MSHANRIALALDSLTIDQPLLGVLVAQFKIEKGQPGDDYSFILDEHGNRIFYNPEWIDAKATDEIVFGLGFVGLSTAFQQNRRCGARNPALWRKACSYTNALFLVTHRIGRMPSAALYDPAYAGKTPDEVYDILALELRPRSKTQIMEEHFGDRTSIIDLRLSQMDPTDLRGLPVSDAKPLNNSTILLSGNSGIGKSKLVEEFAKRLRHVDLPPQESTLRDVFGFTRKYVSDPKFTTTEEE